MRFEHTFQDGGKIAMEVAFDDTGYLAGLAIDYEIPTNVDVAVIRMGEIQAFQKNVWLQIKRAISSRCREHLAEAGFSQIVAHACDKLREKQGQEMQG